MEGRHRAADPTAASGSAPEATTAPAPVRTLAALGRMSLSGYLLLTLLMAPVLAGWGLGWGQRLGTASSLAFAAAAWLVALAVAVFVARTGRRGPAEVLLRRITHGAASTR